MEIFRPLVNLAATLIAGVICFILGKVLFVGLNAGLYGGVGFKEFLSVIAHGFTMDLSMAAYLTIVPGLLFWCALFIADHNILNKILRWYFIIISALLSGIILLDSVLYGYWRFKLDSTPLFYFLSSPSSALASTEWWMLPIGVISWICLGIVFYYIYVGLVFHTLPKLKCKFNSKDKAVGSVMFILSFGALFIALRGGVTVSTMNLSRAYFSDDSRLNHAAVNPTFSLMYSLSHQDNFDKQFRFFPREKAAEIFAKLKESKSETLPSDTVNRLITHGSRPDIYLIILESFSSHLFPSLGGEPIALKLDSIAREGLLFTNFYANSFRTDRGLAAIISGYPGQPNTSIMKYVAKTEGLPSWPGSLRKQLGYATEYYYGGDANFTNMKAYLVNAGFEKITSDKDFPLSQRLSKWGVHDDVLFSRVAEELTQYDRAHPKLRVIQTSSSHEPFEVPYDDKGRFPDPRAKAFAYTDSCVSTFINTLRLRGDWENSLVIIVPDHYGAYPELENPLDRHKIPLIITGGSLALKGDCDVYGSQIDLASTILGALGINHTEFDFSRNLLNPEAPHFGFFADPSLIGIISASDTTIYNLDSDQTIGRYSNRNVPEAKAFLQILYDDLSRR